MLLIKLQLTRLRMLHHVMLRTSTGIGKTKWSTFAFAISRCKKHNVEIVKNKIVCDLDRQQQPSQRGCHCRKLQDQPFAFGDDLVLLASSE